MATLRRVIAVVSLLAVAVWLGGLVALGAIAAPVVFTMVSFPMNADAMIVVFQRFDLMAMSCAAAVLATEATRVLARVPYSWVDHARAGAGVLASAAAVVQGVKVSPRIAELHAGGAIRGLGPGGRQLAELHDIAQWCGKAQVVLLAAFVALQVVGLTRTRLDRPQS